MQLKENIAEQKALNDIENIFTSLGQLLKDFGILFENYVEITEDIFFDENEILLLNTEQQNLFNYVLSAIEDKELNNCIF